jgi:hypothetical protein
MASSRFKVRMFGDREKWVSISRGRAGERLAQLLEEGWHEVRVGGRWHELLDEGDATHAQTLIERGARCRG